MGIITVSSSYSVFYLWATESFTNSNLAWKPQCEEGKDTIILLIFMLNSIPLYMGKEKKSAGSCERSLYLQNIPFIASLPLRNLQGGRQSGSCRSNEGHTSGLSSLDWLLGSFPFEQPDSLRNFEVQSVQLHTTPCHAGQEPERGLVLLLALPAPAGIS